MADDTDAGLSLAFMREHPERAARVLEALPAEAAAELFRHAPARLSAAVLAAMLPQSASRCLAALDDERVLQLLAPMGTQTTVALLRCMPAARRRALVDGLPTASALASTLLLGFDDDTLGALADPDVLSLPEQTRCGDALQRLGATGGEHAQLFVVDAQRRLRGSVTLPALLRAPPTATLGTLMQRPAALLAAMAPLAGSTAHPGWEQASALPVVEHGDRLVGMLSRDALARALRRAAAGTAAGSAAEAGMAELFVRSYWQALSGVLEAALALWPRVAPVAPQSARADESGR